MYDQLWLHVEWIDICTIRYDGMEVGVRRRREVPEYHDLRRTNLYFPCLFLGRKV